MKIFNNIKHNQIQHDKIASVYDKKHVEIYNDYEQKRLEDFIDYCIDFFKNGKPKVLDFGAGTGNLSRIFSIKGCAVTACDVSQKSLDILNKNLSTFNITTVPYDGITLPFIDNHFDMTVTYSVLHHIPDYIFAVKEMIRVTKKGGLIYIDHEANDNKYNPPSYLAEFYGKTKQTLFEHIKKLFFTGELFTFDFIKTVFIKIFFNKRYEREGDIHVWADDHIDWSQVKKIAEEKGCEIIKEIDYLMYRPKKGMVLFEIYKDKCNDTKCLILRKIREEI